MPEHHHITISELQGLIGQGLGEAHPLPYWVVGEVSDGKLNGKSGHFYFDLVDTVGDTHTAKARISAMIWKKDYKLLGSYFTSTTGMELADGMKVMVKCRVCYHELYGLSLAVTDIEPSYTLGEIEHQRLETIRRLQEEDVLDMNKLLGFPMVIQSVAVVSSATAAGYQDFVQEIAAGRYNFSLKLFDAFMQGDAAEDSIIAALDRIAEEENDFDAVVIIRGGGSQSDLGCFNSYRLCYYMTQFPLPIITGIGHDKDNSVADLVAAHFVKTPTAVATFLKERIGDFDEILDSMLAGILSSAQETVGTAKDKIRCIATDIQFRTTGRLSTANYTLQDKLTKLRFACNVFVKDKAMKLAELSANINDNARLCISNAAGYARHRESLLEAYDPARILERGYSIVRYKGSVLKDISRVGPGDGIEIENKDNYIEATINKIKR